MTNFQISNNVTQIHICKYFEKHEAHLIRQHIKLPSSIPTMGPTCQTFYNNNKKTHTYQTHNYVFSHIETYYLKHGIKLIFCFLKHVFLQHFLNHSFHIILNNNTRNLQPTGLAIQVMILLLFFSQSCTLDLKSSFFLHPFFFGIFFHQQHISINLYFF